MKNFTNVWILPASPSQSKYTRLNFFFFFYQDVWEWQERKLFGSCIAERQHCGFDLTVNLSLRWHYGSLAKVGSLWYYIISLYWQQRRVRRGRVSEGAGGAPSCLPCLLWWSVVELLAFFHPSQAKRTGNHWGNGLMVKWDESFDDVQKNDKEGKVCAGAGRGSVLVCWPLCTSTGLKSLNTFPELISVLKLIPLSHFSMPSVSNFTKSSISASPLSCLPTSPPPHSSFVLHLA